MKTPDRLAILTLGGVIVVAACVSPTAGVKASTSEATIAAAATAGCSIPTLPPDQADSGPVTGRSSPVYPPILDTGRVVPSVSDPVAAGLGPIAPVVVPNGTKVQTVVFEGGAPADAKSGTAGTPDELRVYFSDAKIGPSETIMDLYAAGGSILKETSTTGQDASHVQSVIGDAATIIKVDSFDAALVQSSPWPAGFRTRALYWSDGVRDYSLIGRTTSKEIIAVAQSMFCGSD